MSLRAKCAIAGLGATRMGKNYDHPNAMGFAIEAVELALADAGLKRSDLNGLLVNPGGGQLSSFYMWGMTPICEGVLQIRGEGGKRRVPKHDLALVYGNGGILSTHSTLVMGPVHEDTRLSEWVHCDAMGDRVNIIKNVSS